METTLETTCDTPGCTNRVRSYPWNSDHRHETRFCIPCALRRQQPAEGRGARMSETLLALAGEEWQE